MKPIRRFFFTQITTSSSTALNTPSYQKENQFQKDLGASNLYPDQQMNG